MVRNRILQLTLLIILLPAFLICKDKQVIDLKVALTETANLAPAQAGATIYLMQSDWAIVSEINEDVAVWLTGYERKKNLIGQQVISLTLELREPSSIRIGNFIKKERITVRYWNNQKDTQKFDQKFLNDLNRFSRELKVEAYHLGVEIESALKGLLN